MSLSRFNYEWPTYAVQPAMMEGVAVRLLCWQRSLTGWNEARQRVDRHPDEHQERGPADRRPVQIHQPARGHPGLGGIVDHKSG